MWKVKSNDGYESGVFYSKKSADNYANRCNMQAPKGVSYVVEEVK